MSKHNKTCRVCKFRVPGVGGKSSTCSMFKRDIKRDTPRCSTSFLEREVKVSLDTEEKV